MEKRLKVIITGATGMVGEGVLHECIHSDRISAILLINRRTAGVIHPKVKEIIHTDFLNFAPIQQELSGYDACFFCLGVSSVGMKETEYFQKTYTLTMQVATMLAAQNPGMVFCYVSGMGTDSTEKGKLMWARVKGKTENDLQRLPFKAVYNFRPSIIEPTKGLKNTLKLYHYFGWLLPLIRLIAPSQICTLREVGQAMIRVADGSYPNAILEVKDIQSAAKEPL